MTVLGHQRFDAEFAAETRRLADAVSLLRPEQTVPACPEWTVRDLVTHVGTGHRWAAGIVAGRLPEPPPYVRVPAPQRPERWRDWLTGGAQRLSAAIRAAGPDHPVWTWRTETTALFWLRRMLHDELIHRFDAEMAAGPPGTVAPDLAVDGVADLLASIAALASPGGLEPLFTALAGTGQRLCFRATDTGDDWLVERAPGGVSWREGDGAADVSVAAPARDLLLVLNRRLDPDRAGATVEGRRDLLAYWLRHTRF